jgi:copper ion binding protein
MSDTRIYDVPAISCGHCKSAIEGEVSQVDGVSTVDVDIDARRVTVEGQAADAAIRAAIAEAGYEVAAP